MRWPWERTPDEKANDRKETDRLRRKVQEEMARLQRTLDEAEKSILKEIPNGG